MKKLLIVVDYQQDFVTGSLGFAKAQTLEQPIAEKIRQYQAQDQDVAYTMDSHGADYLQTQEGEKLPIAHCIRDSEGWQLYGSIRELLAGCRRFEKDTFGSLDLLHYLEDHPYDFIELVGLVSNICVVSNAVLAKTAQPQAVIQVDAHCTASGDDAMQEKVLDVLAGLQVQVVNRREGQGGGV